jgi:hypothetical protein
MDDSEGISFSGPLKADLIRKLENPLSFIGESTLSHICFDGSWTRVSDIISRARKGPKSKDRVLNSLRERLQEIRSQMKDSNMSSGELQSLFEEGVTVKKAIYTLKDDVSDDEKHSDTRRWLDYGRSIS